VWTGEAPDDEVGQRVPPHECAASRVTNRRETRDEYLVVPVARIDEHERDRSRSRRPDVTADHVFFDALDEVISVA
jgi:hypothetical protein